MTGAGPNRMNRSVVIRAAAGLTAYLKDEGRVETRQTDVLDILEARFGAAAAAQFAEAIHGISELDRLKRLHRLAVTCDTIDSFSQELATPTRGRRRR